MDLNDEETELLIKVYIGQKVRSEGIVEETFNAEEKALIEILKEKELVEDAYWASLRSYSLYKTTEKGDDLASKIIQKRFYETNLADELRSIPLFFLKLILFDDEFFYNHNPEWNFKDFYWDDGITEILIEKGLEFRDRAINSFKKRGVHIGSNYYVSTGGGRIDSKWYILPEQEIKEYINKTMGIDVGLSEEIKEQLITERKEILKKRENILFDQIIEDYSPKFASIRIIKDSIIKPIRSNKGISVFFSYSSLDEEKYGITSLAENLKSYEEIENVYYWRTNTRDNFIEYMNDYIGKCDIMILFCSPNSLKSQPVENEWTAAEGLNKPIIPVYTNREYIPPLLNTRLGLEYTSDFMWNNIQYADKLKELIVRRNGE